MTYNECVHTMHDIGVYCVHNTCTNAYITRGLRTISMLRHNTHIRITRALLSALFLNMSINRLYSIKLNKIKFTTNI